MEQFANINQKNFRGLVDPRKKIRFEIEFEKIKKKQQEDRPKFSRFEDIYSNNMDELRRDITKTRRRQGEIEKERKEDPLFEEKYKLGELGEIVCLQGYDKEEWLSAIESVFPTSRYDDWFRGTDMIFRFKSEEKEPLYLGIDVKTSRDRVVIANGHKQLREEIIEKGKLTELKYFFDEDRDKKGKQQVPSLLMVIDPRYANALQELMVKFPINRSQEEKEKMELIKKLINMELISQLITADMYLDLEEFNTLPNKNLQKQYQMIIKSVREEVDLKAMAVFLKNLIVEAEQIAKIVPDLVLTYKDYLVTLERYLERREI